jgi:hypothetical protein
MLLARVNALNILFKSGRHALRTFAQELAHTQRHTHARTTPNERAYDHGGLSSFRFYSSRHPSLIVRSWRQVELDRKQLLTMQECLGSSAAMTSQRAWLEAKVGRRLGGC